MEKAKNKALVDTALGARYAWTENNGRPANLTACHLGKNKTGMDLRSIQKQDLPHFWRNDTCELTGMYFFVRPRRSVFLGLALRGFVAKTV